MRNFLLMSAVIICTMACSAQKKEKETINGSFIRNKSTEKIDINHDGTYTIYKPQSSITPVFEQCEIASKGKWNKLSNEIIELTSEDIYLKQKGYEYEMKKENSFSKDSLYIKVNFHSNFHPVKLNFSFNNNVNKSISQSETLIKIKKSEYLWFKNSTNNLISFDIEANHFGVSVCKSRVLFSIFEEYIDTEKYNFLTITLANFDRCFFEFEPYNKELIFIKDSNQLYWQGDIWIKASSAKSSN